MHLRLLDFLACPDCRSEKLDLLVEKNDDTGMEIAQGSITCCSCNRKFSIISGIPRMLPKSLTPLAPQKDEFPGAGALQTMRGYDFHHQRQGHYQSQRELAPDNHDANLALTRRYFRNYLNLSNLQLEELKTRIVLDAGCGPGRYMAIAHEYGAAEIIGLDLSSGGLLTAKSLLRNADNCHLVQGDITCPPFREGIFDIIYSIGVLHHLQFPENGFYSLKPLLSKHGQLWIWVYGLEGMSLVYQLSHLVWLRQRTKEWTLEDKFHLCKIMAMVLYVLYLYPLFWLKKLAPAKFIRYFPYYEWTSLSYEDIIYNFFDRLQPQYTHYLAKDQIMQNAYCLSSENVMLEVFTQA